MPPFVIGWSTLLITLALFHMSVAGPLWIAARQTGQWTPALAALLVGGYAGFALSAWFVTRFHRRATAAALIFRMARVVLVTVLVVIIVELCGAAWVLLAATAPASPQQVEWSAPSAHQAKNTAIAETKGVTSGLTRSREVLRSWRRIVRRLTPTSGSKVPQPVDRKP